MALDQATADQQLTTQVTNEAEPTDAAILNWCLL